MVLFGTPRLMFLVTLYFFIEAARTRSTHFLDKEGLDSYVKNPSEIEDYDIVEPAINNRGRQRRSIDDTSAPQVTFRAFGEDYQLDLVPAPQFFRPDLEIEYVDEEGHVTKESLHVENCFYYGQVTSHNESTVALSICNGLMRGIFADDDDTIYVTPLTNEHAQDFSRRYKRNSENVHLIYKRNVDDGRYCDVEPPASFTAFDELTSEEVEAMTHAYVPPKFLEMCVILDKDFISKRTPDHMVYALTLLNIVNRRFSEPSLGIFFKIFIVRIIMVESDTPTVDGANFHIDANDVRGTLASLRSWSRSVNPSGDDDPDHWDNLLTFSGKDLIGETSGSGLLGVAYVGGTCLAELGISLNEDFGLTTGIVASHEVGHTLTLRHDQDEGCDPGFVMGSSIRNGQNIFKWSECSSVNLMVYLSTVHSACLDDAPSGLPLFPLETTNLPGQTTSWEAQCNLIGANSTCGTLDCGQLKCLMGSSCTYYGSHALAEGTACGRNMICLEGECVNESSVPLPVDGGWSEWTETPCSRTCGGGIIIRERVCNNPSPAFGGLPCEGEGFEPRMCNTDIECQVSPDDYRNEQCAATANEPASDGMIYGWTEYFRSFLAFSDYCQNPCLRSDNRFYSRRPPGLNTDGTECWNYNIADQSRYLRCARGYCLTFGCDGIEGSSSEFDRCSVCNGDGSSCTCVNGTFSEGDTTQFNNWHEIPSRATSILITNNDVARGNHVAITGISSAVAYFRGSGSNRDSDTRASLRGFIILHDHSSTSESFRSTGPTPESLLLEVYLSASVENLISYTYCMPNAGSSYFWDISDYGDCSETCNGTKVRSVTCVEVNNGSTSVVDDSLCVTNLGTKPDTVTDCNVDVCPFWVAGDFENCTAICGNGTQTRNVSCRTSSEIADDNLCDPSLKPPTEQNCTLGSCRWVVGEFGECSVTCGNGTQIRNVSCENDLQIVSDDNCEEPKPDRERRCDSGDCFPHWRVGSYSPCLPNCGKRVYSREVTCWVGITEISRDECDASTRPSEEDECISTACPRACDVVFLATDAKRSGTFTTPRFPRRYPRRSKCSTWIFAEEGKSIEIIFRRFLLQANQRRGCKYDYLLVKDLIAGSEDRYCGRRGRFRVTLKHQVLLSFRSDVRRNFRGFIATFVVS